MMQRKELDRSVSRHVGARIRDERLRRGWTQTALVEAMREFDRHYSVTIISHIENPPTNNASRNRSVTVDELFALARVLDVPPTSLLPPVAGMATRDEAVSELVSVDREGIETVLSELQKALRTTFGG